MHPRVFLETFWRLELRPQIFVAMSFDDTYKKRFDEVIAPAIQSIQVGNVNLKPYRVDNSKTGDSILTDIMDGIAHSQLILADVSSIGKDSKTGFPYRNANVMYEVGLALACRQSSEVLLVRDDEDKFLFDVSTVPHKKIDFTNKAKATSELVEELEARLKEQQYENDARIELAIAGLSQNDVRILQGYADVFPNGFSQGQIELFSEMAFSRLLDKELIKVVAKSRPKGETVYVFTPLGSVVAQKVKSGLPEWILKAQLLDGKLEPINKPDSQPQ
jgi:hypothetical protein